MRKYFLLPLLCSFFIIANTLASSVQLSNSTVSLLADSAEVKPKQSFWVALKIAANPGWHVYWKNPGDSGMAPELSWQLPDGFEAGEIQWLPPKKFKVAHLVNYGYEGSAYFLVKIKNHLDEAVGLQQLKAHATWLICKEDCIPEQADLSVDITVGEQPQLSAENFELSAALDRLSAIMRVKAEAKRSGPQLRLMLPKKKVTDDEIHSLYFYPEAEGAFRLAHPQSWSIKENLLQLDLMLDEEENIPSASGLLEVHTSHGTDYFDVITSAISSTMQAGNESYSLLVILLMAFLGGVILNAMPCVFPVLSLKALAIAKKAKSSARHIKKQSLAYTAGVVLSFVTLALTLISLKYAGQAIGWGYQLQSPLFVTLLIFVLFLVGLNLSGLFEIEWMFAGGAIADRNDWLGSFMTGVLATLVASPCTAPFMATAVGYALTQAGIHTLLIFIALGLGLAFPFLLLSFFPKLIRFLPKPGKWMITLRQLLSFPIFLTCVWLLWVLAQQVSVDELALVLSSLVFIVALIWLWQLKLKRHWLRVASKVILISLIALPFYFSHFLPRIHEELPYSPELLTELLDKHQPVFVHATAAWCITCKTNELLVLSKPDVQKAFKSAGVTILKADWTNKDAQITEYLAKFSRSGVPLYVFYSKEGKATILPQILTKSIIFDTLE